VRALIQSNGPVSSALITAIRGAGGSVVRQFTSINGLLADLPINKLLSIAGRSDVDRMSADHLSQQSASHLEVATGTDRARNYGELDGSGVGIAILDSGIMASHSDVKHYDNLLKPDLVAPGNRIVAAESKDSWLVDEYRDSMRLCS
jgi:hypothetical protein